MLAAKARYIHQLAKALQEQSTLTVLSHHAVVGIVVGVMIPELLSMHQKAPAMAVFADICLASCSVGDVMTPDPLVVRPETNIEAAARILLQRKVRRLPVVNDSGKLVGMFSRSDVIKAAMETRQALHAGLQAGK